MSPNAAGSTGSASRSTAGHAGGYAALAEQRSPRMCSGTPSTCAGRRTCSLSSSVPEYWQLPIAQFHTRIGDPETEKGICCGTAHRCRGSTTSASRCQGQGSERSAGEAGEAEQIVEALKDKGVEHEYLLFPDEGHGLVKLANRERFQAAAERFLAQHPFGGRSED